VLYSTIVGAIAAAGRNSGEPWSDGTQWDDGTGWTDAFAGFTSLPGTLGRDSRATQAPTCDDSCEMFG
jgi:hypothetical protein